MDMGRSPYSPFGWLGVVSDSRMISWVSSNYQVGKLGKEVELGRGPGAWNKIGPTCALF